MKHPDTVKTKWGPDIEVMAIPSFVNVLFWDDQEPDPVAPAEASVGLLISGMTESGYYIFFWQNTAKLPNPWRAVPGQAE